MTTPQDTAVVVTLTGTDADGDVLTYEVVDTPLHGLLSGTAPLVTYTPETNYQGPDVFTFRVSDGTATSQVASVTIIVSEP